MTIESILDTSINRPIPVAKAAPRANAFRKLCMKTMDIVKLPRNRSIICRGTAIGVMAFLANKELAKGFIDFLGFRKGKEDLQGIWMAPLSFELSVREVS